MIGLCASSLDEVISVSDLEIICLASGSSLDTNVWSGSITSSTMYETVAAC